MQPVVGDVIPTGSSSLDKLLEGGIPHGEMSVIAPPAPRPRQGIPPGLTERELVRYFRNVGVGKHGLPMMPPTPPDFYSEGVPCWSSHPSYGIGEVNMRVANGFLNQPKFDKSVIEAVVARYGKQTIDFYGIVEIDVLDPKPFPLKKHQRELLDTLFQQST